MKIAVVASGTAAEVRRARALAEELAARTQLSVRTCVGDAATVTAWVRQGGADAWLLEPDGAGRMDAVSAPREVGTEVLAASNAADGLEVAQSGRWFQVRGRLVDLSTRPVLMRILWTLFEARIDRPNQSVSVDEVAAAVWRNERMQRRSAENRVRVALSTLRGLGLRGILVSRFGGVMLDPSVRVRRVSTQESDPSVGADR